MRKITDRDRMWTLVVLCVMLSVLVADLCLSLRQAHKNEASMSEMLADMHLKLERLERHTPPKGQPK